MRRYDLVSRTGKPHIDTRLAVTTPLRPVVSSQNMHRTILWSNMRWWERRLENLPANSQSWDDFVGFYIDAVCEWAKAVNR